MATRFIRVNYPMETRYKKPRTRTIIIVIQAMVALQAVVAERETFDLFPVHSEP